MKYSEKLGAVVFAAVLVVSTTAAAGAAAGGFGTSVQEAPGAADDPAEADEIYVYENGDAVLVSEEAHEETDDVSGTLGLDAEQGLVHLLYTGPLSDLDEGASEEPLTGDAALEVTPDSVGVDGSLTTETPEEIVDLAFESDIEQSRTQSTSFVDLQLTVEGEEELDGAASMEFSEESTVTGSTYESSGSLSVVPEEVNEYEQDQQFEVTLTETSGAYDLDVTEQQEIGDFQRDRWETPEAAQSSLESRYAGIAMQLGGTVDVTLGDHAFEAGAETNTVDLEYTVRFEGVKDRVAEEMAMSLAQERNLDLNDAEAQAITDRMAELRVDRLHVAAEATGSDVTAEWDAEISNYDEVVLGMAEIAESVDEIDDEMAQQIDDVREMTEAQEEAGLVQTSSVDLSASAADDRTTVEFTSEIDTENWDAYVSELEDRDLDEYVTDVSYSMAVETEGDELDGEFDVEYSEEEFLETALDSLEENVDDGDLTEEDRELLDAIDNVRQADFEMAKASVAADEGTFEVQSAAKVGNLSAFDGYPIESDEEDLTITGLHVETDNGTTTGYLTVQEYVGENPTEDEVRATDRVGADTVVHMPGEWDEDDLPSVDVESAQEFLGLDEGESDDSLLPGGSSTTMAVGVLALLAIGGFVAHRRDML